jgi:hypothetical protein
MKRVRVRPIALSKRAKAALMCRLQDDHWLIIDFVTLSSGPLRLFIKTDWSSIGQSSVLGCL